MEDGSVKAGAYINLRLTKPQAEMALSALEEASGSDKWASGRVAKEVIRKLREGLYR